MIIGVLIIGLKGVVIHKADTELSLNPVHANSLKLKIRHGSGSILCQRVVDMQSDLCSSYSFPFENMSV